MRAAAESFASTHEAARTWNQRALDGNTAFGAINRCFPSGLQSWCPLGLSADPEAPLAAMKPLRAALLVLVCLLVILQG